MPGWGGAHRASTGQGKGLSSLGSLRSSGKPSCPHPDSPAQGRPHALGGLPAPLLHARALGRDVGIQLETSSAPPTLCPLPQGTFVHLLQLSLAGAGQRSRAGAGGAGGPCLEPSRLSRPPHASSLQQRPGAGRRLGWAAPALGSPPWPPHRARSCSSSPACAATPAWTGPAPTSRSRSGSWRAPSGRPAWTREVGATVGMCWPRGDAWAGGARHAGMGLTPQPCPVPPPRVPQAAAVPASAGGQREHGPGGPGPPPDRHHPVHRPHGRRGLPPRGRPLPALPRQPPTLSRQVFFSR